MAVGQRTGKQKVLFVISILIIISAALGILVCLGSCGGIMSIMDSTGISSFSFTMEDGKTDFSNLDSNTITMILLGILMLILLPVAIINLIIGLLGIRGANNASKVGAFTVFAVIGLIIAIISLAMSIFSTVALFQDPSSDPTSTLQELKAYVDSGAADIDKLSYMDSGIAGSAVSLIFCAICVWLGVRIKKEGNPTQTQPQVQVQVQVQAQEVPSQQAQPVSPQEQDKTQD